MKEKSPRKILIYILETVIFAVADILILLGVGMFLVTRGGYGWLALGMFKDMLTGFGG